MSSIISFLTTIFVLVIILYESMPATSVTVRGTIFVVESYFTILYLYVKIILFSRDTSPTTSFALKLFNHSIMRAMFPLLIMQEAFILLYFTYYFVLGIPNERRHLFQYACDNAYFLVVFLSSIEEYDYFHFSLRKVLKWSFSLLYFLNYLNTTSDSDFIIRLMKTEIFKKVLICSCAVGFSRKLFSAFKFRFSKST